MSPELLTAVRERIELGHQKADIVNELKAAGYGEEMVEEIYEAASAPAGVSAAIPPYEGGGLIGYSALLKESLSLVKSKWKLFTKAFVTMAGLLVGLVLIVAGVFAAGASFEELLLQSPALLISMSIVAIVVVLLFALALRVVSFSIIKNLTSPDNSERFTTSLKWSMKNSIPIILLGLFVYLATQTGYLLLLIPGIALALYVYFAEYIFATEGLRGLDAMVRSTEIVYGRWWSVAGRLLVVTFVVFCLVAVSLVAGIVLLAIIGSEPEQLTGFVMVALLVYLLLLFVVVSFVHCAAVVLFQSVHTTAQPEVFSIEKKQQIRFWFKVMVIFGPIAAILLQVPSMMSDIDDIEVGPISELSYVSLSAQATTAYFVSEEYYLNEGGFSYEGVCEQVPAVIEEGVAVECNATVEAWAVRLSDNTGSWCTDSTEYDKQSYVPLNGSASCLTLPAVDVDTAETLTASTTLE